MFYSNIIKHHHPPFVRHHYLHHLAMQHNGNGTSKRIYNSEYEDVVTSSQLDSIARSNGHMVKDHNSIENPNNQVTIVNESFLVNNKIHKKSSLHHSIENLSNQNHQRKLIELVSCFLFYF